MRVTRVDGVQVPADDGRGYLVIDLPLDVIEDLGSLSPDERLALEGELLSDVRLAIGLCVTLRNRRMRDAGPLAS